MGKRPDIKLLLTILVGELVLIVDGKVSEKSFNGADMLRNTAVNFIDELWTNITDNTEWMFNVEKSYGSASAMLLSYKTICDKIDRFVPPPMPRVVAKNILNHARIQKELTGLHGLYGSFCKLNQEPPHMHKTFQGVWDDLAETVLQNSNTIPSISSSLESTHRLITGGGQPHKQPLYRIILKVSLHKYIYCHLSCLA